MKADILHQESLVWDAHECFPLRPDAQLEELAHFKSYGVNHLSINIGMDYNPQNLVLAVAKNFRQYIKAHSDKYIFAQSIDHIVQAKKEGKLSISFDLEGSDPLEGKIEMLQEFYQLGVRQMLLAYNLDNQASGGCEQNKIGLTSYGEQLIKEMNRLGIVVDLSHMGYKATMEAMEVSKKPVIFSHSNPLTVHQHARNISDQQIKKCAQLGGVIGINGIGMFLGDNVTSTAAFIDHVDYIKNLVGPEHVGIGLDYVIDRQELLDFFKAHPDRYPPEKKYDQGKYVEPKQIPDMAHELLERKWDEQQIKLFLGENFFRVAKEVW